MSFDRSEHKDYHNFKNIMAIREDVRELNERLDRLEEALNGRQKARQVLNDQIRAGIRARLNRKK